MNNSVNNIEGVKINKLDQKESNPGKRLNQADLDIYFDERFFDDLKKGDIKIKKYRNMYIFEQKDKSAMMINDNGDTINKFYVKENTLEKYLKQKQKTEQITLESDALLNKFLQTINTKGELTGLQNEVIESSPEKINTRIDSLLMFFENNKDRPRAPKAAENGYSRRRLKQVVRDNIASLKSIKRELKNYDYTTNINYFEDYVDKLEGHKEQLEEVRQIITTGGNTAEIPTILDSMQDVRKEELFQNIAAEYNFEFNKIMKNITLKKLWNKDAEGFQTYLKGVWSGDIEHPSQDKFYEKHKEDFEEIMKKDPALYADITTKRDRYYNYEYASTGYNKHYNASPETCKHRKGAFEKSSDRMADKLEEMGLVKNPKQKEAVKKLGKYAMIGTAVFLGFKVIQKLFFTKKEDDKNKLRNAALYGGGLLALLNIDKVTGFGKDLFNIGGKNKTIDSKKTAESMHMTEDDVETYVKPQYTTVAAIGGVPINTLLSLGLVVEENGKLKIDHDKYKPYIEKSTMDDDQKELTLTNLELIQKDESILTRGLSSLGIETIDDMKKIAGNDNNKTLLESKKTIDYIDSITSGVSGMLNKEGLKPKDSKAWYEITQEYKKGGHTDKLTAKRIREGLVVLGSTTPYTLNEMIKNPDVNLEEKKINGLDIKFETYTELFEAMNLTNEIKKIFKNKSSINGDTSPFHINTVTRNIQFNDKYRWDIINKNEGDTDVVNANFYENTLKNTSPSLNKNKNEYVEYLNNRWNSQ